MAYAAAAAVQLVAWCVEFLDTCPDDVTDVLRDLRALASFVQLAVEERFQDATYTQRPHRQCSPTL